MSDEDLNDLDLLLPEDEPDASFDVEDDVSMTGYVLVDNAAELADMLQGDVSVTARVFVGDEWADITVSVRYVD